MNETKPESRLSLAIETAAFLLILAAIVLVVPLLLAPKAEAHGWGNGDNGCHGANQASCRPDPQPSHGADCIEHGRGGVNDDHCAAPSMTPTASLIPPATGTPGPTGFEPPAVSHIPDLTPPATSTAETPAVAHTDGGWLSILIFLIAAVCGAALTPRRVRRGHR